ncbi:lipopolysaccharide kinase InaA family protein [Arcobacter sp. LA11]|uniref:lipopolysaccharide kinase InaA family protein n=1 Tax=Arcobacter sp. LA11 TaxID=1898176 RepID=UPI0009335980|nr:lipopolysaccharide kinase InaA family protein [Arcobacter sp. LA11]
MSIKYQLNDKFKSFEEFLFNIKNYFFKNLKTIHKARNELKVIDYDSVSTVVKAFRIPNKINQVVYAYFRDSKAKKSYQNAITLEKLGINTPSPIGYIEFYEGLLFKESFFISKKFDYDYTIREPLRNKQLENREEIIKEFVKFTYNLHQNNVYHKDYSAGNTLVVKKDDGSYEFSVVDINRMQFKFINLELGLDNFAKLWLDDDDIVLIASEYAFLGNYEKEQAIEILRKSDKKLKSFVAFKRKIRGRK